VCKQDVRQGGQRWLPDSALGCCGLLSDQGVRGVNALGRRHFGHCSGGRGRGRRREADLGLNHFRTDEVTFRQIKVTGVEKAGRGNVGRGVVFEPTRESRGNFC
jgi:hypothetical protein